MNELILNGICIVAIIVIVIIVERNGECLAKRKDSRNEQIRKR